MDGLIYELPRLYKHAERLFFLSQIQPKHSKSVHRCNLSTKKQTWTNCKITSLFFKSSGQISDSVKWFVYLQNPDKYRLSFIGDWNYWIASMDSRVQSTSSSSSSSSSSSRLSPLLLSIYTTTCLNESTWQLTAL